MKKELEELKKNAIKILKLNDAKAEYLKICLGLAFAYGGKDTLIELQIKQNYEKIT